MFKRIGLMTIITMTILFSGFFGQSTEASANVQRNLPHVKVNKFIYIDWQQIDWDQINDFLNRSLENWQNIYWDFEGNQKVEEEEAQKDEPEIEEPEEVQPQPEQPNIQQPEQPEITPPSEPNGSENRSVEKPQEETPEVNQGTELSQFEEQVVHLTNEERRKNGLAPLEIDEALSKVARDKSYDLLVNNYFDHNSPTYGSPFDMMKAYGISYRTAGENIAKGQRTPEEVVNAWMNSSGHRANILNGNFTHIGVGYIEQGNHWTQMFIGK